MSASGGWRQRQKTVFITGAARGIGKETARQLVAQRQNVALVDVLAGELEAAAVQLGDRAIPIVADVTEIAMSTSFTTRPVTRHSRT
jgi:NAD(P)-dependent dehydrogenase (short-subunit alcohol dehydrogenase family)